MEHERLQEKKAGKINKTGGNTVYSKQGVRWLTKFSATYKQRQIVDLAF